MTDRIFTARAIGANMISPPNKAWSPIAIGSPPTMVVAAVITTGLNRSTPPCKMAPRLSIPERRKLLM